MGLLNRVNTHIYASDSALGLKGRLNQSSERQQTMLLRLLFCLMVVTPQISSAGPSYSNYESSTITRWLLRAELALAGNQLVAPPEDNALAHLERVLAEDSDNRRAAKLLNQLIVRFTMSDGVTNAPRSWARLRVLHHASGPAYADNAGVTDALQKIDRTKRGGLSSTRLAAQTQHAERDNQQLDALARTARERMHKRLVELKNCRVSLGLAALQLGDTTEAGRQQEAAAAIVSRHRLDDGGLGYLSRLLERDQTQPSKFDEAPRDAHADTTDVSDGEDPSDWYYRVVGTF